MEAAELVWPDDKEIEEIVDEDSVTERNTESSGENGADINISKTSSIDKHDDDEKFQQRRTTTTTNLTMDDYFFQHYVRACRNVSEATSYLEIFNYSDSSLNSVEEHPLTMDEFENFLNRRVRI